MQTKLEKAKNNAAADPKSKNYLTPAEISDLLSAARKSRHSVRDYCMILMAYRHGLRVSELIDIRLSDLDLETARFYVRRIKGSMSTHHPVEGDEIRAIRAWLKKRDAFPGASSSYLFLSERGPFTRQAINYLLTKTGSLAKLTVKMTPHMLRHSTGYYLANENYPTRLIQDYLGHKNIMHTVRYTRTAVSRFEGLWR